MIMQSLILIFVFTCVFLVIVFALPRKTEMVIRERLVPLTAHTRKRNFFFQFLGFLAPINHRLGWKSLKDNVSRNLATAGVSLSCDEYLALKELLVLFLPVFTAVLFGAQIEPYWFILAAAVGFIAPNIWLKRKIANRHNAIAKALPEVIDLLNLAVGAGLDFMLALQKVVERSAPNPFVEELYEVWQETKMGKSRRDALKAMARRINLPEVSSFVTTLVQAERMGTSVDEVLRIQAEEARNWRFQRGERLAMKAPIKLLLPLVFFILPVVLIIVGGPILLRFMTTGPFMR